MTATVHADPKALFARMLRRCVRTDEGCWRFTGASNSRGYSIVGAGGKGKTILGHQLAMLAAGIDVPQGHNIDHQCHDSHECRLDANCPHRLCVNPAHLAVVLAGENTARRWERGLCEQGHPFSFRQRGAGKARYCSECSNAGRRVLSGRTSSNYWASLRNAP